MNSTTMVQPVARMLIYLESRATTAESVDRAGMATGMQWGFAGRIVRRTIEMTAWFVAETR